MQHAGLQYGQGAANSHQSPPFAHADIPQSNGGNTTSSLRQFRKKDGTDKSSSTDLNTSIENSHIARVPPHNHYPARPNDYYRYQHQYPDYNSPFKETPAQVKYSEIAETPPQPIQHVDHLPAALQKHKDVHKDFMDMCNISQQTHMKQNYPDNLARQQSYPPDAASVHHQYLHKEPQVHPGYKPESQYQQYPQIPKYNMPSQCRKYPPPPPPENDFLAKLQRLNPSMARSIMSEHHIRESQGTYPTMDQNRMYQNQRYYPPTHIQNNLSYNYQPYNYTSSCNYKHPDYARANQMAVGGAQYPAINPHADRSMSPRNLHMMNYGTSPQKISPNYSQYNPPEYAQHYQHRRTSLPQEYYQQPCRTNPYMAGHQISPESADNRGASGGLRHFIENWAEEEATAEITPIFKENIRIHNNDSTNEQVFVINSSDIPQCLENVSLVPTENGQFIIKTGALDNSVVRIKETTENNGERTVNLQIVEAPPKPDCMLTEENDKTSEETPVPYQENQKQNQNEKDCDEEIQTSQPVEEQKLPEKIVQQNEETEEGTEESPPETSVIVSNEVSVIKDMPLIDEEHKQQEEKELEEQQPTEALSDDSADSKDSKEDDCEETREEKEPTEESHVTTTTRRTQRIFSVDDIINNIGSSPTQTRRNSLQFIPKGTYDDVSEETETKKKEEVEESAEQMEYRNAISVEDDSVILEIGGAWVQLNINHHNGTKVLSVLPLSESLVIDVNGNCQPVEDSDAVTQEEITTQDNLQDAENNENAQNGKLNEEDKSTDEEEESSVLNNTEETVNKCESAEDSLQSEPSTEENPQNDLASVENLQNEDALKNNIADMSCEDLQEEEHLEDFNADVCQSEVVIGEESAENDIVIDLNNEAIIDTSVIEKEEKEENEEKEVETPKVIEVIKRRDEKRKPRDGDEKRRSNSKKLKSDERRESEERFKPKKTQKNEEVDVKISKRNKNEIEKASEFRKEDEDVKNKDLLLMKKSEKKVNVNDEEVKRKERQENPKVKKQEKKLTPQISIEEDSKKKDVRELKRSEKKIQSLEPPTSEEKKKKKDDDFKVKKAEKKLTFQSSVEDDESKQRDVKKSEKKSQLLELVSNEEETSRKEVQEEITKIKKQEKKLTSSSCAGEEQNEAQAVTKSVKREKKFTPQSSIDEEEEMRKVTPQICPVREDQDSGKEDFTQIAEETVEDVKDEILSNTSDVVQAVEEMIALKQLEESKESEKLPTKAAKKLYVSASVIKEPKLKPEENKKQKKSIKIEETVNKIKSLKEKSARGDSELKKTSMKETVEKKSPRITKKVTFNLETEVREISKEEIDRKRLSWEEYNSRKRKSPSVSESEDTKHKIMEDTVTSTEDISDEVVEKVELSIENEMKDSVSKRSSPKRTPNNWEDDTPSPESPTKNEVMSTNNRKCIIDVNEFNIKPIESVSTPSPVSSSQFSYHSEDDSLQVYKDVVDSKLNSLNIKIPKLSKPKPVDRFSVLLDRFLNKGSLNCEELEEVKKFIEIKRKMMAEEKKLTYEVRNERDYKDLKLHFRKVPEKRKKKRFRNLYAEDTSDDSDSSRSEKGAGDYSVYQRDSQGVPKLIIKRNSGLPQPFVKLERSQAVELLAKKRKLY